MDAYLFEGQRLYVLKGFMDAAMSAQGGAADEATEEDAEPMAVICYALAGAELEGNKGGAALSFGKAGR
jgi:hypothetical protein